MGEGNQAGPGRNRGLEAFQINLPGRIVLNYVDFDAPAFLHLQQGDVVRDIFGPAR